MRYSARGFTLVELIVAMVILAILAVGAIRYITLSAEAFVLSAKVSALATSGRISIERINREVRAAVPNSARVSADGACLEFLPVVGATRYMDTAGYSEALASRYEDGTDNSLYPVAPVNGPSVAMPLYPTSGAEFSIVVPDREIDMTPVEYVLVGPSDAAGVYANIPLIPGSVVGGTPRAVFTSVTATNPTGVMWKINLSAAHAFPTDGSPSQRVYFADDPISYCVDAAGRLSRYTDYGLSATQYDPGTALGDVIVDGLANTASEDPFAYAPGAGVRKAIVSLFFRLRVKGQDLVLSHEIQMRNTP